MTQARGTADTKRYDLFKTLVALGLLLIIVILLLRGERFQDKTAAAETPVTVAATPTSAIEATAAVVAPTFRSPKVNAAGKLSLLGAGTPGSTVEIWAGGQKLGQAPVDAAGDWMFSTDLAPGAYDLTARAVDEGGETLAETEPVSVEVPKPITAPTFNPPQVDADGKLSLIGTGTPGSTVEIWAGGQKLGQAPVDAAGDWMFSADLAPGEYDLTARAVDEGGGDAGRVRPRVGRGAPAHHRSDVQPTPGGHGRQAVADRHGHARLDRGDLGRQPKAGTGSGQRRR